MKLLVSKCTDETFEVACREVAKVRLPIVSHVLSPFQASSQLLPRRVKRELLILQCLARLLEVGTNLLVVVGLDGVACGIAKWRGALGLWGGRESLSELLARLVDVSTEAGGVEEEAQFALFDVGAAVAELG